MQQIDCGLCRGKGHYPVAGFLIVFDQKCSRCKGTGKVLPQVQGIQWLSLEEALQRYPVQKTEVQP